MSKATYLKEDSERILSYMASNGLVANAAKTVFMILNRTRAELVEEKFKSLIVDGAKIEASSHTKLLGVEIQDDHVWNEHFNGKNGLINALNKRTFNIRRIANQIPKNQVIKVVQSLWMSKLIVLCFTHDYSTFYYYLLTTFSFIKVLT